MLMLRNEAEELGFRTRDDDESFGFVPYNGFFIAISWYKERGRTGNAVVMQDEMDATLLTLEFAETVVRERCGV
jgi:hypothetical protein